MSSLIKNILTIVVLLVIAGAGYYFFVLQNSAGLSTGNRTSEGELLTAEFLKRLKELEGIDLSGSIFSNPKFTSLVDFSTEPDAVSAGRDNPFAF